MTPAVAGVAAESPAEPPAETNEHEPPTEPIAPAPRPAPVHTPIASAAPHPSPLPGGERGLKSTSEIAGPFAQTRYRFTTGLRAGEVANIRGDDGKVLLSYRSFASVAGIVAAFVSGIVTLAGLAAVLFLIAENSPARAIVALVLTLIFAFVIALLVPRVNVTLYDEHHPALTISQRATHPGVSYIVAAPNGAALGELRKTAFSRIGRHRWRILQEGRLLAEAVEESWTRAMMRKVLGKFSRRFETNFRIEYGGLDAGRILRRPDEHGAFDVLELKSDALDRRVAVALATLILGREP
jgi:hypothetical protein